MRLDEMFVIPGQMTVEDCVAEAEKPQFETAITPSGLKVHYQWAPKRLYRLSRLSSSPESLNTWAEVPSVTTVLNVLDKSGALTWWGMKVGVEGVRALWEMWLDGDFPGTAPPNRSGDEVIALLTEHKLTVNHVKDKAADRGVNVHDALESWCRHGVLPIVEQYPETERGYIEGLCAFLTAIQHVAEVDGMEVMVGSLEHLYAGRFDLVLNISSPVEVVTRCYPKRADKMETIPAGRYLLDLKTRRKAQVYNTNYLQLEAYEKASVECGYQPTDYRAVIVVTQDGKYQLSINQDWCFEDFLAVRNVYSVLNEREIIRQLREDLGAREVG